MDPLAVRNYDMEEFAKPQHAKIQRQAPGRSVFGRADPYREYMDEFDEPTGKEEHNIVVIPRYSGPKNTRVDKYKQEGSQYRVTGLTSHLQHSSVYLHQTFTFSTTLAKQYSDMKALSTGIGLSRFLIPPFFIQRQWNKLYFSAPQADNIFEMDCRMNVKLAPYLSSAQCINNLVKTKISARRLKAPQADGGGDHATEYEVLTDDRYNVSIPAIGPHQNAAGAVYGDDLVNHPAFEAQQIPRLTVQDYEITIEAYEPLLGFQSGWSDLDCVRPFNQQHNKFPLALQDYDLRIEKLPFRMERSIKHRASCANDDTLAAETQIPSVDSHSAFKTAASDPRIRLVNVKTPESAELVSFSDDSAKQANKTVSTVQLHAPVIQAYRKQFIFPQDEAVAFKEKTSEQTTELLVGEAGTPKSMSIRIETSKGLPSFFVIYLEDFGPNVDLLGLDAFDQRDWKNGQTAVTSALHDSKAYDRNTVGACHPKATGIRISVQGDTFPLTAQLGKEELEYMTHKNSHKYCDFRKNMTTDPIVFLKLEDLGLANCQMGYPHPKRTIIDIDVTKIMFAAGIGSTYYTIHQDYAPKVELSVGLVYENHLLEGNTNRVEFLWR